MKVAVVCIACQEDNYIKEWLNHYKICGFDDIFIYQNNWRFPFKSDDKHLHLIEWDGQIKQLSAYNSFKDENFTNYDFAFFCDCDEYICLKKHDNIKEFLKEYLNFGGIGINWKNFGDSHLNFTGDYSIIQRFTLAEYGLHKGIKTFINFNKLKNNFQFISAHCINLCNTIVNVEKTYYINGPFNETKNNDIIQLNHYRKTRQEFIKRRKLGYPDQVLSQEQIDEMINTQFDNEFVHYNEMKDVTLINYYHKLMIKNYLNKFISGN